MANTILSAHQPIFLPYLGFWSKMKRSDVFVLMDCYPANFGDKNKFDNRNKIRIGTEKGWQYITVPIIHTGKQMRFNEIKIDNTQNWQRKILRALEVNYGKAKYFKKYYKYIKRVLCAENKRLSELNIKLIFLIKNWLDIKSYVIVQSGGRWRYSERKKEDLKYLFGSASDKIVQLCYNLKIDHFLFGADGKNYADMDLFEREGIEISFQEYEHPVYEQVYEPFIPQMSVIDALFNIGEKTKELI
nr:MAG: WbqC-like protein [Lokiarchaeota virus Ratatoskr Meg22_1012]